MSRTLEINVLSAEDLRIDRKPVRKNAYVVVKIDPFNSVTTRPDEARGSYPAWKEKFEMEMPLNGRIQFILIEAFYRTSSGNEKKVGFARMPVTDFMGAYAPEGYLHFLSYRLRDDKGDRNGIVNVSVRVKVDERSRNAETKAAAPSDFGGRLSQGAEFRRHSVFEPLRKETKTAASSGGFRGGVVTGVPVSFGHRCTL